MQRPQEQTSRPWSLAGAEPVRLRGGCLGLRGKSWKEQAQVLQREVRVVWLVFKDSRTPWYARLVAAIAVGYVFSPIQLIPSFIPVIGFLDDFLVLSIGFKLARWLAPDAVIRDCREQAATETAEEQEMRLLAKPLSAVIVGTWVLVTIAVTVWLYRRQG